MVVPFGKAKPEAGVQVTVGTGQPAETVGVAKVTAAVHCPGSVFVVMLAGQVIAEGACRMLVVAALVVTIEKLLPDTAPWFETEQVPAGSGLLTVTLNMIVTLSPGASEKPDTPPIITVSPDSGLDRM